MTGAQCETCTHFRLHTDRLPTCAAFPKGVPSEIILGKKNHRREIPGDHGIVWEPKKQAEYLIEPESEEDVMGDPRKALGGVEPADSSGGANPGGAERDVS
jgi:hypothetical protein